MRYLNLGTKDEILNIFPTYIIAKLIEKSRKKYSAFPQPGLAGAIAKRSPLTAAGQIKLTIVVL